MPAPLVALFWLWLIASVAVLVYRQVARRRPRPPRARGIEPSDRALRADWGPGSAARPETGLPATPPTGDAGRSGPEPDAGGPTLPPSPPTGPPAASLPDAGPAPAGAGGATTLMEALSGIAMPCDLMPLTTAEGRRLSDRELLLVTSGHEADEVGEAFADAVEALGYTIVPMGPTTAVASRGDDQITLVVHERPADELAGARPAFPTTRPGDVVLELRL